jgi:formylglycine-generating enzyme required for sulfatase activity
VSLKPFYLMKTPVTEKMYRNIMGINPSIQFGDNNPIVNVSWEEAILFAKQLSLNDENISEKAKSFIKSSSPEQYNIIANSFLHYQLYRLPTEAEWEYVSIANSFDKKSRYTLKKPDISKIISHNLFKNSVAEMGPVGMSKPNFFGIYDLMKYPLEWTSSEHLENYYIENNHYKNPLGSTLQSRNSKNPTRKVVKGEEIFLLAKAKETALHYTELPSTKSLLIGFRLAKSTNK